MLWNSDGLILCFLIFVSGFFFCLVIDTYRNYGRWRHFSTGPSLMKSITNLNVQLSALHISHRAMSLFHLFLGFNIEFHDLTSSRKCNLMAFTLCSLCACGENFSFLTHLCFCHLACLISHTHCLPFMVLDLVHDILQWMIMRF